MVRVTFIFLMIFSLSSCYNTGSMGGNFLVNTLSEPLQKGVFDALSGKHQNSKITDSDTRQLSDYTICTNLKKKSNLTNSTKWTREAKRRNLSCNN